MDLPRQAERVDNPGDSDLHAFIDAPYQSGPMYSDLQPINPVVPPPPEIRNSEGRRTFRVSGPIQQAQLISRVEPRYPAIAVQTKTEGTVVLHAIISRDGRITALEVVSGHPLLVQAALDAVRQWRYRPTYLGGEAVEVETSITVTFRLSQ
jgi:periplasmic protein TonB